jgi:hypothetical protein
LPGVLSSKLLGQMSRWDMNAEILSTRIRSASRSAEEKYRVRRPFWSIGPSLGQQGQAWVPGSSIYLLSDVSADT